MSDNVCGLGYDPRVDTLTEKLEEVIQEYGAGQTFTQTIGALEVVQQRLIRELAGYDD